MEIITGVERRRRWSVREKLRIVSEAEAAGANYATVARRHDLSRGLLWYWRKQVRLGLLRAEPIPVFVPLRITDEAFPPDLTPAVDVPEPASASDCHQAGSGRMAIELSNGHRILVERDVDSDALRRVLNVLVPQ